MCVENPEFLLAAVGIDDVLTPGRLRFTAEQRNTAQRMSDRIVREIRRFLNQDEFEPIPELPPFDFKAAAARITEGVDVARMVEAAEAFDGDANAALAFAAAAGRCYDYLASLLPRATRPTVLGPEAITPSAVALGRFRRAHAVANEPMTVCRNLRAGVLSRDEAAALEACYPGLYEAVRQGTFEALAAYKVAHPKGQLTIAKTRQLEALMQTHSWSPELVRQMQEHFKQAEPNDRPKRSLGAASALADATETPMQRISNK